MVLVSKRSARTKLLAPCVARNQRSAMTSLESHLLHQVDHSASFFWHRVRFRALATFLPRERPFRLLDVGAGAGFLGDFLRREYPRATYLFTEPLEALERGLEQRFGAAANARTRGTYSGIDYITLLDVLEHQADDRGFLRDLFDRMDIGATLILTVPAMRSLWSGWDVALGHFRRYDKPSLREALSSAAVEVHEINYLFPELVIPALVRKRRGRAVAGPAADADFPSLPPRLNNVLTALGTASVRFRRLSPIGTSLLAVATRVERAGAKPTAASPA
jgi:hypothetical protein